MPNPISRKNLIKKLKAFDFEGPYAGSRHQFLVRGDLKLRIPNPHQKDISAPLVKEILKQANISSSEWDSEK